MQFNKIERMDTFDKPIAVLEWREAPGRTFEVHVDVHPEYQRKGIGRQLIDELVHKLIVDEREPMSLYTFMAADNDKAKQFFAAVGFHLYYVHNFYGTGRSALVGCKTVGVPK